MNMVASLQMYTTPVLSTAVKTWWRGIARHLIASGFEGVPEDLIAPKDIHSVWHRGNMLFSQTCGAPLIQKLGDSVRVIGTPVYDTPLTNGIHYSSAVIVARDDPARTLGDLAGKRVAINSRESFSGYLTLKAALVGLAPPGEQYFYDVVISGAHFQSIRAVANGEADCAAIDGVTFALTARDEPELVARVRVLDRTALAPGLPYITKRATSDNELEALRSAVTAAIADPALETARSQMLLVGFTETDHEDYAPISQMIKAGRSVVI